MRSGQQVKQFVTKRRARLDRIGLARHPDERQQPRGLLLVGVPEDVIPVLSYRVQ
jgi:hypothetical protein